MSETDLGHSTFDVRRAKPVTLQTEVQFLKGVGPLRAREFERLGVRTVSDLIEYYPFRHELRPKSIAIGHLELDQVATIVGELKRVRSRGYAHRQTINAICIDATGECHVRWFNSPFLADKLRNGLIVRLTAKVEQYRDFAAMTNPTLTIIEDDGDPFADDADRYDPVYPATAELTSSRIARVLHSCLDEVVEGVQEFLPEAILHRHQLPRRAQAIRSYHKPNDRDDIALARRRLAYEELLLSQLAVQFARRRRATGPRAQPVTITTEIDQRIRARLPFTLTEGQDGAVAEIVSDLARDEPMNRMLQADVGAGKTAVSVYAALATIANKRQVALLAPTEVLARQHNEKVSQYLKGSRVRMGYLAGSTARFQRPALLRSLGRGEIDLVIGTHALLEEDVQFPNLGLVVIDEQHKFGVAQRARLRGKAAAPHTLVLSATPIPRTLAMTVFGELDVSTIRGALPNRQPVDTRLVTPQTSEQAWHLVRTRLAAGEQAYIVYPLIEESETSQRKAAAVEVERLQHKELRGFKVGLLHGRMSAAEKSETMNQFRDGAIHALASTTVIEVGVDVANATLMIIQHAESYGLSQLHQLRGRVGRGKKRSYCLLFTESSAVGAVTPAQRRLQILCETTDGFRIAEEDLRLRGPGELLGTRQHGLPEFRVADLVGDLELLQTARDDAASLVRDDPTLSEPQHAALRTVLAGKYADAIAFLSVG